jgi:HEAT repeat protein
VVAAFTRLLEDSDQTIRGIGLSAVKQMSDGDQVAAAPQLAAMLDPAREDKPDNRVSAARTLGALKSQAADVAGQIAAAAKGDPDPKVRSACHVALTQVAPPEQAAATLAEGLADQQASVRLVAVARLRQLGAAAAPAKKQLAGALADSDARVGNAAGQSLVNIGKDAVGVVAEQLNSQNRDARKQALACLATIGPDAAAAVPAIEKLLQDSDPQVKQLAAAALDRIKSP